MRFLSTLLLLAFASTALASSTTMKQIDSIQNSSGGSALSVPSVGSAFVSDSATQTLTNKTISGSSNTFSNIPASAISSGQLGVANGGTGAATLTAHAVLLGEGTSAVSFASPTQYESLIGNASGDPSFQAVPLNQSAAVTGVLGHANGGSDANTLAGGAANFLGALSGCSTSGYYLNWNGSAFVCSAIPTSTPSLNGGSSTPQSVTAAGGVSLSSIMYQNFAWVVGSPSAVTVTATPSVTAGTADGQKLVLEGTDNTKTVTLQDQSSLSGSGLYLNGPVTLAAAQTISLHWDANLTAWVEDSRSN